MRSFLRPRSLPCLVNPTSPNLAEAQVRDLLTAARTLGLQVHVLEASTDRDFDAIFANLAQLRAGGLVVTSDSFFKQTARRAGSASRSTCDLSLPRACCGRWFDELRS